MYWVACHPNLKTRALHRGGLLSPTSRGTPAVAARRVRRRPVALSSAFFLIWTGLLDWRAASSLRHFPNVGAIGSRLNGIGNVFSEQQIYGFETFLLNRYSYQQKLFDGRVELRLGRFAATDDFLDLPYNYGFHVERVLRKPVRDLVGCAVHDRRTPVLGPRLGR